MSFSPTLLLHICAGTLGLLSGAAAIAFRKGSRWHRLTGNVFVISMLGLGASGVYLGIMKNQTSNVFGGLLTCYLVSTAWVSARPREWKTNVFELSGILAALGVATALAIFGLEAASSPTGSKNGVPAGMSFFLCSVTLLAAAGDIRLLVRGSISGAQRLARHLWRMCFSLFIATGSFFLGQQQVFPSWLRQTKVLLIPALLPLLLLIIWLIRVRFSNASRRRAVPAT